MIFRCIHWVTEYVRLLQPDALWFRLRGWACKLRHGPALSYWSLLKVLPWDRDEGSQHVETRRVKTEEGACMDTCDLCLSYCKFVLKWLNIELPYYGLLSSLFQLASGVLPMSEIVLGHKYDIPGLVEYASPVATWIEVLGWSGRKDCQNAAAESHRTAGEKVVNCVVWYQYFTAKFVLGTWKSGGPDAESGAYRPKKTDYANQLLVPWELTLFRGDVKRVTLEVMLRHWATSHQTTV